MVGPYLLAYYNLYLCHPDVFVWGPIKDSPPHPLVILLGTFAASWSLREGKEKRKKKKSPHVVLIESKCSAAFYLPAG